MRLRSALVALRSLPSLRPCGLGLGLGLAMGLLAVPSLGCDTITCNSNQCAEGLQWYAETDGGGVLLPGTYVFDVELDGTSLAFECTIGTTVGDSECDQPTHIAGDGDFDTEVDVRGLAANAADPTAPIGRIELRAYENVEGGVRGPDVVHITAERDGLPIIDAMYDIKYERDENYHGDERCGFCDLRQTRTYAITQ